MNRLLLSIVLLASTSSIFAHDHHCRSREELVDIVVAQEKVIAKKEHIIAKQGEMILCLEAELHHIKHELHREHRYHALVKALRDMMSL